MNRETADRFSGALLGLATGDALGTTVEFSARGTFPPVTDIIGGGPFRLKAGQWTDDTSMALCLAESLVECQGFDAKDQMERYVRWFRLGHLSSTGTCFDIGGTTRAALGRVERAGEPVSGSTDPNAAGNGSLMRLAPVPMAYELDPQRAVDMAGESPRTTHGAPEAVDACRYFAALMAAALTGTPKEALFAAANSLFSSHASRQSLSPRIGAIASAGFMAKPEPSIRSSGYVVHTLEAALWAFFRTSSFREGCLLAVNLGDDADTTGAVFGQIAGAHYGASGIPAGWLGKLAMRGVIEDYADRLAALSVALGAPTGGSDAAHGGRVS